MIFQILAIIFGFVVLAISSKQAVKRIVKLARYLKISEFIISFIIVGTVAVLPELSISLASALDGIPSFGLGILLGSNIGDLTIGLGIVAIATNGLKLHKNSTKQMNWYLLASILPVALLLDGEISQIDGALLLLLYIFYIVWNLRSRPKAALPLNSSTYNPTIPHPNSTPPLTKKHHRLNTLKEFLIIVISLLFLLGAGKLISDSSEQLGQILALPLFFIGAIVALGTCLPEVSFAIEAGREGHADVGFGDIVGVVFADCTLSIGLVAIVQPIKPTDSTLALFTGLFMIFSLLITMFLVKREKQISRKEGFTLLLIYLFFLIIEKFL